jgi:hypothetical protein
MALKAGFDVSFDNVSDRKGECNGSLCTKMMRLVGCQTILTLRGWPPHVTTSTVATVTTCHVRLWEESRLYVSAHNVVGLTFRAVGNAELFACPQDGAVALRLPNQPHVRSGLGFRAICSSPGSAPVSIYSDLLSAHTLCSCSCSAWMACQLPAFDSLLGQDISLVTPSRPGGGIAQSV